MTRDKLTFAGNIDEYRDGAIHGWLARVPSAEKVDFMICVDDSQIGHEHSARHHRKDLLQAGIGDGCHAYQVTLPEELRDGGEHVISVFTPDGDMIMSRAMVFAEQTCVTVDTCTQSLLSGWVRVQGADKVSLTLNSEQGCLAAFSNHHPRADVARLAGTAADYGFHVRLPLSRRGTHHGSIWLQVGAEKRVPVGTAERRPLRVAFVCNTDNPSDGSRHYRSELAARQLAADGVQTRLFNERQITDGSADRLDPSQWDVVAFQRVPLNAASAKLLESLKELGQRVLYDVDDLLFKKWRMDELGAIRSGVAQGKEADYAAAMDARLRLIMRCDGVICSTAFLQRELAGLGLPTLLSRNSIEDDLFAYGCQRLAQQEAKMSARPLNLLFMSGSPTHRADFSLIEPVLNDILRRRSDIKLTLLGDVGPCRLEQLPQTTRLPRTGRDEMMKTIAAHDVVLVPLQRTSFNIAKSSLKFIEAAAAAVPVIASPMFEFKRDVSASGAGMIAGTALQWAEAINTYADDRSLSPSQGARAFDYCWNNYRQGARTGHLLGQILALDEHILERERHAQRIAARLRQLLVYGQAEGMLHPAAIDQTAPSAAACSQSLGWTTS